jgi:hypothetical protein
MKYLIFSLVLLALLMGGCTQNQIAKEYGGTMTITLPKGTRLINATWKDLQLWYLVEARPDNVEPRTTQFIEDSQFGVWEGRVIFKEQ